jgi:hypothetical protein
MDFHGLYDVPKVNQLSGKVSTPVRGAETSIQSRGREGALVKSRTGHHTGGRPHGSKSIRPGRCRSPCVAVHTDARIRPIKLGKLAITFKLTAPSRL